MDVLLIRVFLGARSVCFVLTQVSISTTVLPFAHKPVVDSTHFLLEGRKCVEMCMNVRLLVRLKYEWDLGLRWDYRLAVCLRTK